VIAKYRALRELARGSWNSESAVMELVRNLSQQFGYRRGLPTTGTVPSKLRSDLGDLNSATRVAAGQFAERLRELQQLVQQEL
jgi:hypothetical protein